MSDRGDCAFCNRRQKKKDSNNEHFPEKWSHFYYLKPYLMFILIIFHHSYAFLVSEINILRSPSHLSAFSPPHSRFLFHRRNIIIIFCHTQIRRRSHATLFMMNKFMFCRLKKKENNKKNPRTCELLSIVWRGWMGNVKAEGVICKNPTRLLLENFPLCKLCINPKVLTILSKKRGRIIKIRGG